MKLVIPMRTVSGMNAREHYRVRAKRVKAERELVAWHLGVSAMQKRVPCVVTLTRIGPTNGLDPFDNLPSSLKGTVDQIAQWLGVDDRKDDRVRYVCRQERGKTWAVAIEITAAEAA